MAMFFSMLTHLIAVRARNHRGILPFSSSSTSSPIHIFRFCLGVINSYAKQTLRVCNKTHRVKHIGCRIFGSGRSSQTHEADPSSDHLLRRFLGPARSHLDSRNLLDNEIKTEDDDFSV